MLYKSTNVTNTQTLTVLKETLLLWSAYKSILYRLKLVKLQWLLWWKKWEKIPILIGTSTHEYTLSCTCRKAIPTFYGVKIAFWNNLKLQSKLSKKWKLSKMEMSVLPDLIFTEACAKSKDTDSSLLQQLCDVSAQSGNIAQHKTCLWIYLSISYAKI